VGRNCIDPCLLVIYRAIPHLQGTNDPSLTARTSAPCQISKGLARSVQRHERRNRVGSRAGRPPRRRRRACRICGCIQAGTRGRVPAELLRRITPPRRSANEPHTRHRIGVYHIVALLGARGVGRGLSRPRRNMRTWNAGFTITCCRRSADNSRLVASVIGGVSARVAGRVPRCQCRDTFDNET
jgi:hypothetical protein